MELEIKKIFKTTKSLTSSVIIGSGTFYQGPRYNLALIISPAGM